MSVTAKLSVVLRANDVEVAHSEDPELWQQVLLAITGSKPLGPAAASPTPVGSAGGAPLVERPTTTAGNAVDPLPRFAAAVGVGVPLLQGACDPTPDAPFLVLDAHCYEAMRRALPARGTRAITNIQIAGTLLGLWFHYLGAGAVSQAQAQSALEPLGARDANAPRGIANADWLQARGSGQFIVNPARISHAILIARCFCNRDWTEYLNT